eukprot:1646232-Pyramimonas_sp.AAC.1
MSDGAFGSLSRSRSGSTAGVSSWAPCRVAPRRCWRAPSPTSRATTCCGTSPTRGRGTCPSASRWWRSSGGSRPSAPLGATRGGGKPWSSASGGSRTRCTTLRPGPRSWGSR